MRRDLDRRRFLKIAGTSMGVGALYTAFPQLGRTAEAAEVARRLGRSNGDVPSSDQHTVKPWFNGRLDFSPDVKDLSAEGYPLVGGRLDYVAGHEVAALVYRRRQHTINVFAWPGTATPAGEASLRGYSLIHWTRAGISHEAVSDLNIAELRDFVGMLQR